MAYTTPRTWVVGEIVNASQLNSNVRDNVAFLHDGLLGADSTPSAVVQNSLMNSGFDFFQRTAPGTPTSVSDDVYGPDRWYAMTETASVQVSRTTGNRAVNALRLTQNQVAAQRMGIAQIMDAGSSIPLRSKSVALQFACNPSVTTIMRYAILEWTGTADTVTSEVVNSWTSTTYTAGNFFASTTLTVTAVGSLSCAGAAWTTVTALTATLGSAGNNLIVLIWTEGTAAQNVTVDISEAIFSRANAPVWYPRPTQVELADCERFYEKSYALDTAPATATTTGRCISTSPSTAASVDMFVSQAYRVQKRTSTAPTLYDMAGTSARITTMAGATGTDGVTVVGGTTGGVNNFSVNHNDGGNINGISFHFVKDNEL